MYMKSKLKVLTEETQHPCVMRCNTNARCRETKEPYITASLRKTWHYRSE